MASQRVLCHSVYAWKHVSLFATGLFGSDMLLTAGSSFCLGDAVHRHPPNNGLGSNTSIQDSYNLAWKMALVLKGKAHRSLLDTYETERQPVGMKVVKRANDSSRDDQACWPVLGLLEPSLDRRLEILEEFKAAGPAGRERRAAWRKVLEKRVYEHHAIGAEMNQRYKSSAVYLEDETEGPPAYQLDPDLHYQKSTYPGSRLPHAWLNKAKPTKPISTHDLAGKGQFAILTGIGGKDSWSKAAETVSTELGIGIKVTSIGWRQDYEDSYWTWETIRDVEDDGAVLVRPDRYIGWRCQNGKGATVEKLTRVMRGILSLGV